MGLEEIIPIVDHIGGFDHKHHVCFSQQPVVNDFSN